MIDRSKQPHYLGDSIYVEIESGMIKLTTNNGYPDDPRNVIYLDPATYRALRDYAERAKAREES